MTISVRDGGAWSQFPTTPQGTRLLYVRNSLAWKPVIYAWVRNGGAWVREPSYAAVLSPPASLTPTTATTEHHSLTLTWSYSGLLLPTSYVCTLLNQAGTGIVQQFLITGSPVTFSNLPTSTYYQYTVASRRSPLADVAAATGHWYTGHDAGFTVDGHAFAAAPSGTW